MILSEKDYADLTFAASGMGQDAFLANILCKVVDYIEREQDMGEERRRRAGDEY
jgi:hypothetical protein